MFFLLTPSLSLSPSVRARPCSGRCSFTNWEKEPAALHHAPYHAATRAKRFLLRVAASGFPTSMPHHSRRDADLLLKFIVLSGEGSNSNQFQEHALPFQNLRPSAIRNPTPRLKSSLFLGPVSPSRTASNTGFTVHETGMSQR